MENPTVLSTSSSGRRSSETNSPEFEFWMVRNPSCPQTFLHSADELFSGGVLVPLQLLNARNSDEPPDSASIATVVSPVSGAASEPTSTLTASKRWKDIFKKNSENKEKDKKKKGVSGFGGGGGISIAELNINLWPFSRSKSAGNGGNRPRPPIAGTRKVSSAPCSRSNSAGESKSRKWPNSPIRGGVHVGRSSPVWQINRVGSGRNLHDNVVRNAAEKVVLKKEKPDTRRSKKSTTGGDATAAVSGVGGKGLVLNLNVQSCIGYRHHFSCRSDEIQVEKTLRFAVGNTGNETRAAVVQPDGEGLRGTNMFNLRNLFVKKVY
ncbi:uncharacterized protein LOC111907874 [Lactuca sativa]|uniref:Uncharacterized protein n=1 Tax=Lactuca sativa TaxID=4236 RepID=A0A9R1VQS2_LACSA|nr:uncharacterized protein LOC111907874 [Lactuca sativa]KAJ0210815.1 hypothetical protein LSAT_V11C400181170 [Lactuca sativa]